MYMYTYIHAGQQDVRAYIIRCTYVHIYILTLSACVVQILCYCARVHFPLIAFRLPHPYPHIYMHMHTMYVCTLTPSYGRTAIFTVLW